MFNDAWAEDRNDEAHHHASAQVRIIFYVIRATQKQANQTLRDSLIDQNAQGTSPRVDELVGILMLQQADVAADRTFRTTLRLATQLRFAIDGDLLAGEWSGRAF